MPGRRHPTPREKPTGFVCQVCGKKHAGLPLDRVFDSPTYWQQIPEAERSRRGRINSDFCEIDDEDFFIRGLIEIPIIGSDEVFMWGVWVSLSQTNFDR